MLYPVIAPSTTLALKTGCLQKLANVCVLGRRYPKYRMQETSWPVEHVLCPGPDNKGCGVAERRLKGPGPQLLREEAAIAA